MKINMDIEHTLKIIKKLKRGDKIFIAITTREIRSQCGYHIVDTVQNQNDGIYYITLKTSLRSLFVGYDYINRIELIKSSDNYTCLNPKNKPLGVSDEHREDT
jgi:hypothetical protein